MGPGDRALINAFLTELGYFSRDWINYLKKQLQAKAGPVSSLFCTVTLSPLLSALSPSHTKALTRLREDVMAVIPDFAVSTPRNQNKPLLYKLQSQLFC